MRDDGAQSDHGTCSSTRTNRLLVIVESVNATNPPVIACVLWGAWVEFALSCPAEPTPAGVYYP